MNLDTGEKRIRAVIDTNIIVSAIIFKGKPAQLLELIFSGKIIAITSLNLLTELSDVLLKKFKISELDVQIIETVIKENFAFTRPTKQLKIIKDEADNRVLEAAVAGKVVFIITGDKELLSLKTFQGIKIITIAEFLEKI